MNVPADSANAVSRRRLLAASPLPSCQEMMTWLRKQSSASPACGEGDRRDIEVGYGALVMARGLTLCTREQQFAVSR